MAMPLQLTLQHQQPRCGHKFCRPTTFASALFALLCFSSPSTITLAVGLDQQHQQHQQSLHPANDGQPKAADESSLATMAGMEAATPAHNRSLVARTSRAQGHHQELLVVEEVAHATSTRSSAPFSDLASQFGAFKDNLFARVKSSEQDWTMSGGLGQVMIMPVLAVVLAWAIHRPEHSSWRRSGKLSLEDASDLKNVASVVPVLVSITLIAILPNLWLGSGAVQPDSRQMLWSAAQTPLMFMVLGYGIASQNPPNCLRLGVVAATLYVALVALLTLLPADGSMGLESGVTALDFLRSLLPKLLPVEALSSSHLSGMEQIVSNVGAMAICLLLTPGLLSLARGADASGLFYCWLLAALTSLADWDCRCLTAVMDPVTITIVGRLQLPAFVSGIILSSWPRPDLKMRLAGLALLTAYCFSWKLSLSPLFWQCCYRGLFLPVQLPIIWSLVDLMSVPHVGRFFDGRAVKVPSTLPVSFGAVLLLPILAERQPLGGPLYSVCAALVAMLLVHTLEWALWFATAFMEPAELEEEQASITPEPKHIFFGRFLNEDVFRNRLPFRLFQALVYYCFFAGALLTIYCQANFDATHEAWRVEIRGSGVSSIFMDVVFSGIVREVGWCTTGLCALVCIWATTGQLMAAPSWRCQAPTAKELQDESTTMVLCFRYCTRGLNPTLVASNVEHVYRVLELSGLKKDTWRLEVVTDNPLGLSALAEKGVECAETLVPNGYKCPNGGKYKARAMHYAISNSAVKLQHTDWICHLDEETYFDRHSVCSIYQHCLRENAAVESGAKAFPDMGQGTILYNTFGLRPETLLTALADTARVGDDIGKFRLQYLGFNTASMGMHGSFAVINQRVEEAVGFDFGSEGSITEDSYFAMKAQAGINLGMQWIDGYMFEQSPFSVMDLVRQRGRWFHGLFFCTWFGGQGFSFRMTAVLSFMMATWTMSFCILLMNIMIKLFNLFADEPDFDLMFASNTVSLMFKFNYMLGFVHTFSPFLEGWPYWLALLYMQVTIIPIAVGVFETAGVLNGLYLLLSRESVFYIVQKEKKASIGGKI